jgi:hypothetical protein
VQPNGSYIAPGGGAAAAVAFLNLSDIKKALTVKGKAAPTNFTFKIVTNSHGTSTPIPPAPQNWFVFYNGAFGGVSRGNNEWQDNNTTIQFIISLGLMAPTAATNPFVECFYNPPGEVGSAGSLDLSLPSTFGNNPFPTLAAAEAAQDYLNSFNPGLYSIMEWDQSPWPPQQPNEGYCSWSINMKTWKNITNFPVSAKGVLGSPSRAGAFATGPIGSASANSGGQNPPARTISVNVNLQTLQLTVSG